MLQCANVWFHESVWKRCTNGRDGRFREELRTGGPAVLPCSRQDR
jgi:hypothetical protein